MARDVTTEDGTQWNCVQAYAGLDAPDAAAEAKSKAGGPPVEVICTPSGGAQTVRLKLPATWETETEDTELVKAIENAQRG